jgi:hypothetical protein
MVVAGEAWAGASYDLSKATMAGSFAALVKILLSGYVTGWASYNERVPTERTCRRQPQETPAGGVVSVNSGFGLSRYGGSGPLLPNPISGRQQKTIALIENAIPPAFAHEIKGLPYFESAIAVITILSARDARTIQGCYRVLTMEQLRPLFVCVYVH